MTELLIASGLVAVAIFIAFKWGRSKEREDVSKKDSITRKKMLDAAVNSPRNRDELTDRLRSDKDF